MNSLKTYRNIYFRRINIQNYCLSTPAEALLTKDRIFESSFLTETLSDILRFVTLYKFGGIYLDTDIIVQQVRNQEFMKKKIRNMKYKFVYLYRIWMFFQTILLAQKVRDMLQMVFSVLAAKDWDTKLLDSS